MTSVVDEPEEEEVPLVVRLLCCPDQRVPE